MKREVIRREEIVRRSEGSWYLLHLLVVRETIAKKDKKRKDKKRKWGEKGGVRGRRGKKEKKT